MKGQRERVRVREKGGLREEGKGREKMKKGGQGNKEKDWTGRKEISVREGEGSDRVKR